MLEAAGMRALIPADRHRGIEAGSAALPQGDAAE